MKVLIDTSVLVSAILPDHVHHAYSLPWLERQGRCFGCCRFGTQLGGTLFRPNQASKNASHQRRRCALLIQHNLSSHTVVTLTAGDYMKLIEDLARISITGGAVYDAVIAKAAEVTDVDFLLTLNIGHFQRVWPSGASRVVSPIAMTPP